MRDLLRRLQAKYYEHVLSRMSIPDRYYWADKHPHAKKLWGLRGYSELSLVEKASMGVRKK